jgi:hypothetical protein
MGLHGLLPTGPLDVHVHSPLVERTARPCVRREAHSVSAGHRCACRRRCSCPSGSRRAADCTAFRCRLTGTTNLGQIAGPSVCAIVVCLTQRVSRDTLRACRCAAPVCTSLCASLEPWCTPSQTANGASHAYPTLKRNGGKCEPRYLGCAGPGGATWVTADCTASHSAKWHQAPAGTKAGMPESQQHGNRRPARPHHQGGWVGALLTSAPADKQRDSPAALLDVKVVCVTKSGNSGALQGALKDTTR